MVNPKLNLSNRLFVHKLLMSIKIEIRGPSPHCPCPRKESFVYFSGSHRISTITLRVEILPVRLGGLIKKGGNAADNHNRVLLTFKNCALLMTPLITTLHVTRRNMSLVITTLLATSSVVISGVFNKNTTDHHTTSDMLFHAISSVSSDVSTTSDI